MAHSNWLFRNLVEIRSPIDNAEHVTSINSITCMLNVTRMVHIQNGFYLFRNVPFTDMYAMQTRLLQGIRHGLKPLSNMQMSKQV